jgi:alcohol dehydrogenase (NADP+)
MKFLSFKNGDQIPMLGLGTWKSKPGEVYQAILWAIEAGYRHIDCAAIYMNEKEIGEALKKAFSDQMVRREELFITSKLWNDSHRKEDVKGALKKTLKDLNLSYLDLYLVHWPVSFKPGIAFAETREEFYTYQDVPITSTWMGMQEVQKTELTRHIGVSNFNTKNLEAILKIGGQGPEMNQIELHPFLPQHQLVNFCKDHDILLTAYSPLGSRDRSQAIKKSDEPSLLEDATVIQLAEKYEVSPALILIAFSLHRGIAVIPKSVNQSRIIENLKASQLELEEKDLELLLQIKHRYRFIDGSFFTGKHSPYKMADLWESDEQ